MKTENVITIDSEELVELAEKQYGGSFEIIATEEWNNDSTHRFDVKPEVKEYAKEKEIKIRNGEYPMYCASTVLNCLCKDGILKPAIYMVEVCW